jgi:HAD superfamily hydrolase (TIGR01509 family)
VIGAVVFDFDGLILDTESPVFHAWRETYELHGIEIDRARWQTIVGTDGALDPLAELEEMVGEPIDRDAVNDRRRARRDELLALESVRPGIAEYLADAHRLGLSVGIASSSPRSWILEHLERLGLADAFACIRGYDDVNAAKPSPASYLAVCQELGVATADAIAVEDSPNGIKAAKAAGLWCLAVPNPMTADLDLSEADLVVASLVDLPLPDLLRIGRHS